MIEEFGAFFQSTERAVHDWKAALLPWAHITAARAGDSERLWPGAHELLVDCAEELCLALSAGQADNIESRHAIGDMCTYLHASASTLHELVIPPHESDAHCAAKDLDSAALQMLASLKSEFGEPTWP